MELLLDQLSNETKPKFGPFIPSTLSACMTYYDRLVAIDEAAYRHPALDDALMLYRHDRTHYSKMVSTLLPILAMLDAGEIGGLLSPRYADIDDPREVYDSRRVIEGNKVFYVGLDSLSDKVVSSAIGSILLSDFAAWAGGEYNYSDPAKRRRITLIVDESADVANSAFQQIVSKARGSGFMVFALTQTVSDFIDRFGTKDKAYSFLGNFNNLFALRIMDPTTREYVSMQFGKAFIDSSRYALGTSTRSDASVTGFTGSEGVSVSETLLESIPPDLLAKLPNHEFFALLAGGKLYKGRQYVLN